MKNRQSELPSCEYVIKAHQLCMDLNKIMIIITSSHDVEEMIHDIVQESCKSIGCESARIAMREEDRWVLAFGFNLQQDEVGRTFSDEELPHAALAMITKRPVAIVDALHDNRANMELMKATGMLSVLVLPLLDKGSVVGAISFGYHSATASFTDAEIDYAEKVATGVAIALQNARRCRELQQARREMEESKRFSDALNHIDAMIYSTHDSDQIMKMTLHLATDAIGAETAMIFSREADEWVVRYVYKLSRSLLGRTFSNREVLHATLTAGAGEPLVVSDTRDDHRIDKEFVRSLQIRSLLNFPLIVKGEVIGNLVFHYHTIPVPFTERQVEFVRTLQNSISLALENARLFEALQQSEFRQKEAEKIGNFGHFHYDLQTEKLTWSEGMFMIFNRQRELGEPTVQEFFQSYMMDPGREEIESLLLQDDVAGFDALVKHDNFLMYVHLVVHSVRDEKGVVTARFGTVQDITHLKRAEERLRENESFKQGILDSLLAHVAVLDTKGTIIAVNTPWVRFAEQNGAPCDPRVGTGADYLSVCRKAADMDDPLAAAALEGIQAVLAWKRDSFFLEYPCNSPTEERWFLMNVVRPSHDFEGAVITHLDITSRKQTENELRRSKEVNEATTAQLEAILGSMNDALVISDLEGAIHAMNPAALRLHGFHEISEAQKHFSDYQEGLDVTDLDGKRLSVDEWPLARAIRGEVFTNHEIRIYCRKTGRTMISNVSGAPVRDRDGNIILALVTMRDVTKQKRAEEEVERLNTDLAAHAAELEAANRELEAFNYTVAHDLRKPLTVINGYCQAMRELCGEKLDEECSGYLQEAYDGTWRMNRLIEALLNFSRVAHAEVKRQPVDLSRGANAIASELKQAEPARRVLFLIPDTLMAQGDPDLLHIVLDNLFGNAWKYTGNREEGVIELGKTEIGGEETFFVRDNGIGFHPADSDKVFTPFQRLQQRGEVGGLGIGLATVGRIISRHGGRVWAEGVPEKGAIFYFTLG